MSIMTEKKDMDMRTQRLLSLFLGLGFMILANFAGQLLANMFGSFVVAGLWANYIFLDIMAIIYIVIGICFTFSAKQNDARRINAAALVVYVSLQILLIIFVFIGGHRIFMKGQSPEIFALSVGGGKSLAISLFVGSLAAILIRFLAVRHSLKMTIITDAIVLVISIGLMYLMVNVFYHGLFGLFWGVGLTLPLFVFLPCIGKWEDTAYIQQPYTNTGFNVPPYQGINQQGQYYQDRQGDTQKLFCPNCGMRFSGQKKYCDQCGTQLSVLWQNGDPYYEQPGPPAGYSAGAGIDAPSFGAAVIGFFIPLAGLILFLSWQYTFPMKAKSAGKGALAGVITAVILGVLLIILQITLMSDMLFMY